MSGRLSSSTFARSAPRSAMESQEQSNLGAESKPSNSDEPGGSAYEEKLAKLQKYLPFLNETIAKLEASKDKVRASQLGKMKNLQQILTSPKQRMRIDTLDRCEEVLKKLQEKLKSTISTDKVESKNIVKTEPDDVTESPASPPQSDLNPPRSAPKIIPVERCATVERDYSQAEEGSSLEASRSRLKGLMLKTDLKTSSSTPSPQIPGLDMVFPSQDSTAYSHSSHDNSLKSPTESEKLNKNYSHPTPLREEWPRLETSIQSQPSSNDWPAARDVDERRLNRDLDYRHSRTDVDHRQLPGSDRHGMQVHSVMSHPPLFPPSLNHLTPKPALLPRHMPTHNMSYNSCSSSVQEITRCADKVVLETKTSHQTITFASASSKSPLLPTPLDALERAGNQSRHLSQQREVYDTTCNSPYLPSKSLPSSTSHLTDRKSILPVSSSSLPHNAPQGESVKPSARERIMLRLDQVEKLGVSSGGALRKLKADIEKGKRRPGETELSTNEEACQRSLDVPLRQIDPRLEKEQRRSSLDEEAQKYRNAARGHDPPMGLSSSALPPNMPNFSGHPLPFGSSQPGSVQWNQSHTSSPHGRTMFQGQQSVMNTYWQSTCSVKQMNTVTTAHDLGMRYQPKIRQGKSMNTQYERSIPGNILKPNEERFVGQREPEIHRRENETHHGPGKRPLDPRLASMKPLEEKKHSDSKNADINSKRKEKTKGKDESDFSSPLGSIYHEEKRNKTGQGYGLQSYKIPKRPKEPSPPKDVAQSSKNVIESRITARDPRLSKVLPQLLSPESVKETSFSSDLCNKPLTESLSADAQFDDKLEQENNEQTNSNYKAQTKSPSPSPDTHAGSNSLTVGNPPDTNAGDLNVSSSGTHSLKAGKNADQETRSPSPQRALSRTRSPNNYRTSRARSRSRSRGRSISRSRVLQSQEGAVHLDQGGGVDLLPEIGLEIGVLPIQEIEEVGLEQNLEGVVHQEQGLEVEVLPGLELSQGEEAHRDPEPNHGEEAHPDPEPSHEEEAHQDPEVNHEEGARQELEPTQGGEVHLEVEPIQGGEAHQELEPTQGGEVHQELEPNLEAEAHQERGPNLEGEVHQDPELGLGAEACPDQEDTVETEAPQDPDIYQELKREVLQGSNRRSSPYSKPKSSEEFLKSRGRHSRSRSDSRTRTSPSRSRAKSVVRDQRKSRGRSHSSDSDKISLAERWKRNQSPSPDRQAAGTKIISGARRRSVSSDSNKSRDSSSIISQAISRTRSQGRSRGRSNARSRSPDQSRRSVSRESAKDTKKAAASSRSSSCSGRSSPLFPKGRSRSRSPSKELNFDKLLRKDQPLVTDVPPLSVDKESAIKTSQLEKDTDVSSSLIENVCSAVDVVVDVPTSTSENIPELPFKGDAGSSSEAHDGNKSSKPSSSQLEAVGTSVEPGNIIVGLIKTLASQDLFKQTSLIELAALAASQLPEDKRNKVLEIFRENTGEAPKEEQSKPLESGFKEDLKHFKNEVEQKGDPIVPNATSESETSSTTKKGRKKKQSVKAKSAKNTPSDGLQKSETSPEASEKQKKKRGKNELEKLHEDIREMFISREVVTATGQRSCRMRKEGKDTFQPPKSRPGSADEKARPSRSKYRYENVMDFSDDSPCKDQISLDTTGSTSDCQTIADINKKIRSSSESEDDMPSSKCQRTSPDSSNPVFKRRNKTNFIESDTESDSAVNEMESPKQPKIFNDKSVDMRSGSRNVARRGRKIGSVSRDQMKMREEVYTPSYDGDCDEGEEDESKIEDKDMSQIDTSNIIQIEGAGSKLTRNQLKLLKNPEDLKIATKRALNSSREYSECDSDTSKSLELYGSFPFSPVKKKRKIKKPSGVLQKTADVKTLHDATDSLISDESFVLGSTSESVNEENCLNTSVGSDYVVHTIDGPSENNSDVEMPEAPLISGAEHPLALKMEVVGADDPISPGNQEYHKDLEYTVTSAGDRASCKICKFSGKTIVGHYLSSHPSDEVLISRLSKSLADQAKANVCDYSESESKKFTAKKRLSAPLKCLICKFMATNFMRLYEHVSTHTGEYRYSCTQCNYKAAQRISLKAHRKVRHPNTEVKDLCSVSQMEEGSTSKLLLAYLCSECNYFQLRKSNLMNHIQRYHLNSPSAEAIRICISEKGSFKTQAVTNKKKDVSEDLTLREVSGELSSDSELTMLENVVSDCQPGVSDYQAQAKMARDPLLVTNERELLHGEGEESTIESAHAEKDPISDEPDILEILIPSTTKKPSTPVEMSIFIGSEHNTDDDKKLQEDRKKLLEDAGSKIRERPKIRSSMSEKLAQRLNCGQSTSPISPKDVARKEVSTESSVDTQPLQVRTNLRTTPARLAQKSTENSEKRPGKGTPRTASIIDLESVVSSEVPDEVKAPLPSSTLQSTLQRMQTTIESPVSTPSTSLVSSPSSVTPHSRLKLKKGSVMVGPVEARAVDESQGFSFFCLSPSCAFSTPEASTFLKHIEKHSEKPVSAPCSVCDEGGNILRDLRSSFNHLVKYHLVEVEESNKESAGTSSTSSSSAMSSGKPLLIRPRKMPGDVLSVAEKFQHGVERSGLPSLVISSVISLSKDHTPDGTPIEMQGRLVTTPGSVDGSRKFLTVLKKDPTSMSEMMKFEKICHLFKCMGQHCAFSSNIKEIFAEHYQKHLLKELKLNAHAASEIFEWQRCAYCGDLKDSGEDLVDHILIQHAVLKYQCSGCFYRAASIACVIFHQTNSHCSNVMVFECTLPQSVSEQQLSQLSQRSLQTDHIQVYRCGQFCDRGECGKVCVSSEEFTSHQQSQHPSDNIFYCKECGLGLDSSSKLIHHYSTSHSYRKYHCLYCQKASETKEEISCHMCLDHPDRKMIVTSRTRTEEMNSSPKVLRLPSGYVIEVLDLDDVYSQFPCTFTVSKNQETDNSNDPILFDQSYTAPCHTYDIGSKLSWTVKSTWHTSTSPKSFPQIGVEVGTEKWDTNQDILELSGRLSEQSPLAITSSNLSDAEGNLKEKDPNLKTDQFDKPLSIVKSNKDDNVTNLSGLSLFVCGYSGCLFRGETASALKNHLPICDFAQDAGTLSCVHCKKDFRNPSTLLEHMPKHGVPRYVCGLCDDFRTTHPTIAHRHVRNVHKLAAIDMVPSDPDNPDGILILRPKDNVRKKVKTKIQQSVCNKTSFGPEEKHELPLSAVFTCNVSCKVCNYATKVRSNMLRHLEQHESGCEPSPVPVLNPVPCLERNEKMFDTMTNHAISSTIPVRRDSNAFKVLDEPKFVPENQRFVCCAPACQQISSDDAMLRHHIRVLHPEILVYKCPHCPEYESDSSKQPIMVEKLGSHLKMHDSRLYSCLGCSYYHYQRHIVERHTGEKHPDQKLIRIVREPQPDGPMDTENLVDIESEIMGTEGMYECSLCSLKGNKAEVMGHMATIHRIHAQYKCTLCNFRANARVRFNPHFTKRHPNDKEAFIEVFRKCKVEKLNDETPQPLSENSTPPVERVVFDSTPLWTRNSPRVRHLRGILFEENSVKPREIEHTESRKAELALSVRNKRPSNALSGEDTTVNKRGKRDDASFTCAKCLNKFPVHEENNFREHLRSHFNSDDLRYQCVRCLKSFPSIDEGITHVTDMHQRLFTASDIVDTHSEDHINMDITRQMLEFGLPVEATLSRATSTLGYSPSKNSSPLQTSSNRRLSPRGSVGSITPITSPVSGTPCVSPKKFDSVKGIKALGSRSVLKPMTQTVSQFEQPMELGTKLSPKTKHAANPQADCWINVEGEDIEVDESALEEDIEEVEEEETSSEENQLLMSGNLEEFNIEQQPSSSAEGLECKYKDTHGCAFVSKSKQESQYHEMMHWEIKPWKCAIKQSSVRLHSSKVHQGSATGVGSTGQMTLSLDEKLSEVKMADIADVEEIFKNVHVLRCCFCRLRETSLTRLFIHWQSSHKSNKSFSEKTPDGRSIVPFKFKEVKPGAKGIETMAFKCGLCAKSGTIKLLLDHYPSRHPGEKLRISELIHNRVQCSMCPRQFSAKASLNHHFLSEHPGEEVSSVKVKTTDMSDDLQTNMACLYCSEPVKSALEMKDHHLNFHSHLDAQYIELDSSEPAHQFPIKRAVARKSTSRFRAVARKSTGGRKWHNMRTSPTNVTVSSSNTNSDSDDELNTSCEDDLDENNISCSMMIEGIIFQHLSNHSIEEIGPLVVIS
ncbi:hypothetical protein FOCC_FOCC005139 [Frankliniella occidentalis]|nr:hypothetical protein FOCC_FOCC005139 [Frankliniella occidentalis]